MLLEKMMAVTVPVWYQSPADLFDILKTENNTIL